jgi:branched-chain amino acid transport system permease protein
MVLLGGLQTCGPVPSVLLVGFGTARHTEYWRAMLGAAILVLVLLFPQGIIGALAGAARALRQRAPGARAGAA